MVTNARQIFHTAATNQHDAMFLQIMAFTADITRDFETVGQANASHLAHGRVRLFRRRGIDTRTHAALLRAGFERRYRAFRTLYYTCLAN